MKLLSRVLGLAVIISMTLVSCNKDNESPVGSVTLKASTSGGNSFTQGGRIGGKTEAEIIITDFQISIRDVYFKTDVDSDGKADDSTDVAFRGPYQLDLLNGADAVTQTIGTADVPNGEYNEMRFKFHKDYDMPTDHPLYDRSIFIAGTIDGVPFEMWHDTSENLDIGRNTGVIVNNNEVNLVINFTIEQFLNASVAVDLSTAVDGNQDGLIEINTNDPDGNKALADDLKENIKAAADILDGQ